MRLLACPDKFRGTASATVAAEAMAAAGRVAGWEVDAVPMADGGEGTLEALGGANRTTVVTGPLGDPVEAAWRYGGGLAVVEMALASGLTLVGGADGNDAVAAASSGTGELIAAALDAGARRVLVGVGGSATTDGGLGAIRALEPIGRLRGARLTVACDVRTAFVDAAAEFAPQKGASAAQVELLRRRLERLAQVYERDFSVDVRAIPGSGAAGGLAGGLAAVGAKLLPGFDVVADEVELADRIEQADLVVTGEGFLDEHSFDGKVVGGVTELCVAAGVPVLAVVGELLDGVDVPAGLRVVSLVECVGRQRAMEDTEAAITEAVAASLVP